jgi:selenocysteine lyase/cysteine desulfurase
MAAHALSRRELARLFAFGGSAAFLGHPAFRALRIHRPGPPGPPRSAADWNEIRARFLIPEALTVLNAANLCPAPAHVLQTVQEYTERLDREPVPSFRNEMHSAKEAVRERLARYLRVLPEEVLITRNTSEANNWVSSGLDLGPGDEVLIFADNHPSNHLAWRAKGERFGYAVRELPVENPHPGPDHYVDAFRSAVTARTRVLAFSHLTNTVGDLFPARELCSLARDLGILTLVDGAQTLGLLDLDLSDMQPDFFSGSAHKWPCGPKETGLLYVNRRVHDRFWPSVYSPYAGTIGLSRTHEGMGQRDEPAIHTFGEQIDFLTGIGQAAIETRSRDITNALVEGLASIDGVRLWCSADPDLRVAVVSFDPAGLDPRRVLQALEADGIVAAARAGTDRAGIRFAPHFYNSFEDVDRAVGAIHRYVRTGL